MSLIVWQAAYRGKGGGDLATIGNTIFICKTGENKKIRLLFGGEREGYTYTES